MPRIKCGVKLCMYWLKGYCGVSSESQVDIDRHGQCIDMTEVDNDDYKLIKFGCIAWKARKK